MKRMVALAALAWVGCSSGPHQIVGNGALLESVSIDQAWIALLANDTRYPNGTHTGKLEVLPVTGGTPLLLDGNSDGGTFSRGHALWFLAGVSTVEEGAPLLPHYYGALALWLPGMTAPIQVGSNVHDYFPSQDGSSVVFMDFESPSQAAKGKLVTVAASTCGTGRCMAITLADGIVPTQAAWRISTDGKLVLATIRGANPGDPGQTLLAQPATGDVQILSTTPGTRSPLMTPAGDAIAWVEGFNRILTSPTATPLPSLLATDAQYVESAAMIDAHDFVAKVRPMTATGTLGAASFARVDAHATTPLGVQKPVEYFVSQYVPGATSKYLFYSTVVDTTTTGNTDLWILNLTTAGPAVQLAGAAVNPIGDGVQFSDDGSMVRWFDNYDPTTRLGDLYASALAQPARNLVATGIRGGAFEPGGTKLLYLNAPDPDSGAGVLTLLPALGKPTLVQGVGLLNFIDARGNPLRTYFTQRAGMSGDGVWYMSQP